jgi:transposase InsO family protein
VFDSEFNLIAPTSVYPLWLPEFAQTRKSERFRNYVRKIGLVDCWRTRVWPDLCHRTIGDDFECE